MTAEEMKGLLDEYKAQGLSDEEILDATYKIYEDGKLTKEDLETIAGTLGYRLKEEFDEIAPEEVGEEAEGAAEEGEEAQGDADELTAEEIEDAKEVEPGETDEMPEAEEESEEEYEEEEDEEESESEDEDEDEEETARKIFMGK